MAKVLGILVIVLGVWIGMEIFTKGTDEAFGGSSPRAARAGGGAAGRRSTIGRASSGHGGGARARRFRVPDESARE
jgi:hypothetical protein